MADCLAANLFANIDKRYAAFGWRAARSQHPGGVNVLMADGAVQFVEDGIDLKLWQALSTRSGNEVGSASSQ